MSEHLLPEKGSLDREATRAVSFIIGTGERCLALGHDIFCVPIGRIPR